MADTQTLPKGRVAVYYQTETATPCAQTQVVPLVQLRTITRFKHDGIRVINDISVIVRSIGDERDNFVASFDKANIVASGDTPEEAMHNLCDTLHTQFKFFQENESKLGREPRRQLAVLREFLQGSTDGEDHH